MIGKIEKVRRIIWIAQEIGRSMSSVSDRTGDIISDPVKRKNFILFFIFIILGSIVITCGVLYSVEHSETIRDKISLVLISLTAFSVLFVALLFLSKAH